MGKIISLWSGPRNISTALMYSFAQRPDMKVVDEPLYAWYLIQTGVDHPGREEVIASMPTEQKDAWEDCKHLAGEQHVFLKNMAHHAIGLSGEWLSIPVPVFLIRDPHDMLPSLGKVLKNPQLRDTGLDRQLALVRQYQEGGHKPLVVEGADILRQPREMLSKVCDGLGLPFDERMLSWPAGALPEDGVWARYWYHQVHDSTGFRPWKPPRTDVPDTLAPLLEECLSYYKELKALKIN